MFERSTHHQAGKEKTMLENILLFIGIGFIAQMIDGALGMAFGVSSTTFLLSVGVMPRIASLAVHVAEVITTGISGLSHFRLGNVDKDLVKRLLIPGVVGAVAGAYILSSISGDVVKPYIAAYQLIMGGFIIYKAIRIIRPARVTSHLVPLGLIGGFLDSIGGGGWGPVVVSTLVARGSTPRFTIGSVNLAEFFVAFFASVTFLLSIESSDWQMMWQTIAGLAIGGAIAAPVAAVVCRRLPTRTLMYMVGTLIIVISARTILKTFGVPIP
jgi:uncharacterized membrane protein YfcA